ncbi:MAG: hypothetical protein F6K14_24560 [Symploca sp. SIO2C1]|nr:hypothetical protein [Symploca sp. SIO2C1]
MKIHRKHPLFIELTAEQAATINGGHQLRFNYSHCYPPRVHRGYYSSSRPQSASFKVAASRLDSVLFN